MRAACGGPAYVKVPLEIPAGKTAGLTDAEKAVDSLVARLVANPAAVEHFHRMFKTAVLEVQDFDSLTFTVKITPAEGGPDRSDDGVPGLGEPEVRLHELAAVPHV